MLVPLVAFVGIAGVVLLVRGVRGRRVGDHPVCARCEYDLFGSTPETTTCPECGADRTQPGAIRIGRRQRRRGSIIAGVILLLLALVPIGGLVSVLIGRVNWMQVKPVSWLRADALAGPGTVSDLALNELLRRLKASQLSSGQIDTLVSDALRMQADLARTWQSGWGNIIETARAGGAVSDEDWRTYAKQALAAAFTLQVRSKVRRGDPVPYRIRELAGRVGDGDAFWVSHDRGQLKLGDVTHTSGGSGGSLLTPFGVGSFGSGAFLTPEEWARIPDGPQEAQVTLAFTVRKYQSNPDRGPVITEQSVNLTSPWEIVGADEPTVTVTTAPEHREGVRDSLKNIELTRRKQADGTPYLEGVVRLNGPPVDLAFEVVLRSGSREWKQGTVSIVARGNTNYSTHGEDVPDADVTMVDVIFVPSEEVARRSVDLTNIWGETVVIPDVPIQSDPSASR